MSILLTFFIFNNIFVPSISVTALRLCLPFDTQHTSSLVLKIGLDFILFSETASAESDDGLRCSFCGFLFLFLRESMGVCTGDGSYGRSVF